MEFGTWMPNINLQIANDSFYRKRLNFQGSELQVVSDSEDDEVRRIVKNFCLKDIYHFKILEYDRELLRFL